MAKKHKLDKQVRPMPDYVMPPPNDDAEAYNWELRSLRRPNPNLPPEKEPSTGISIFRAPQETYKTMRRYGHDAQFICPKYLQIMLDQDARIKAAADKAVTAKYSPAALKNIQRAIVQSFHDRILPDIVGNFEQIAPVIAQFYAARMAHREKFNSE